MYHFGFSFTIYSRKRLILYTDHQLVAYKTSYPIGHFIYCLKNLTKQMFNSEKKNSETLNFQPSKPTSSPWKIVFIGECALVRKNDPL